MPAGVLKGLRCNLCNDILDRDSPFLPGAAGAAVSRRSQHCNNPVLVSNFPACLESLQVLVANSPTQGLPQCVQQAGLTRSLISEVPMTPVLHGWKATVRFHSSVSLHGTWRSILCKSSDALLH